MGDGYRRRLPLVVRLVLATYVLVVYLALVRTVFDLLLDNQDSYIPLVAGLGSVVWFGWYQRGVQAERLGGPHEGRRFRAALAGADVPPDADRETWLSEAHQVLYRVRHDRISRRVVNVIVGLAAVGVAIAVLTGVAPPDNRSWYVVLVVAVVPAIAAVGWLDARYVARAERLVAALER